MDAINLASIQEDNSQVSFLSVTTEDDFSGDQWVNYFKEKRVPVTGFARSMLESQLFVPTSGVKKLNIAILKGEIFKPGDCRFRNVFKEAGRRALFEPSSDCACYLIKNFSSKIMNSIGLKKVVVMSRTIDDHEGEWCYFRIHWDEYCPHLRAQKHDDDIILDPSFGYAFAVLE